MISHNYYNVTAHVVLFAVDDGSAVVGIGHVGAVETPAARQLVHVVWKHVQR